MSAIFWIARRAALVVATLVIAGLGFGAQALWAAPPFERVYGDTLHFEQALKGASPVDVCPNGGYVSVGFTHRQGARIDRDVYVVRLAENGAPLWERTYDLNGAQGEDVGTSIREVRVDPQGGFIVAGTTIAPGHADRDAFLLRLDCTGKRLWCRTLRTLGDQMSMPTDDDVRDVIETATGMLAGDFVLAGSSRAGGVVPSPGVTPDAYLVRTDAYGAMRWSQLYYESVAGGNPQYSEWLNALAEARPVQGQGVGDLLAVGGQEGAYLNWRDGLALRVSGLTGGFTAPLHTMSTHNLPTDGPQVRTTELWAIRELLQKNNEEAPHDLVMVGTNAAYLGTSEGYAVRTGPNLNNVLAERLIGDGIAGKDDEGFTDLVEIVAPSTYANPGQLAVTGFAASGTSLDVLLLALDAGTLLPIPGTGRLLGDHGPGEERGTALAQVLGNSALGRNAGFYLNGINRSDPQAVGDLEDMGLIKTDALGYTPCATSWSPGDSLPEDCQCYPIGQTASPGTVSLPCSSAERPESWGDAVCGAGSTSSKSR